MDTGVFGSISNRLRLNQAIKKIRIKTNERNIVFSNTSVNEYKSKPVIEMSEEISCQPSDLTILADN